MTQIEMLPTRLLCPLVRNPRRISKTQFAKLIQSLESDPDFFKSRPCLVNHTNDKYIVYAGNQRLKAAKQLKWKEIPCIVDIDLPDLVMQMRIIKDNKTYGEFDIEMLANEWEPSFLIEAGFTEQELGILEDEETIINEDEPKADKRCPHCDGIL